MNMLLKYMLFATSIAFRFVSAKFDNINCMEMRPAITHSGGASKENSFLLAVAKRYSIYISSSRFQAGHPIKIIIKSCKGPHGVNRGMQAFLLQARTVDTKFLPIGHFNTSALENHAQAISCYYPYDSIVSKTNRKVEKLVVSWIPPKDYRGRIAFYFTSVPHGTNQYYLRMKSPVIHMRQENETSVALEQKCYSSAASRFAVSQLTLFVAIIMITWHTTLV
eukprot:gene6788-7554_t